ncbi:Os05g0209950 [Oryza sativa Japonica Group]|uniref:Os05g0209950 protein n=1 Tax=Oryza sativa subsp. japonica TaxID=39947 RepID=A0A0P0WJ48_ORYSJ|nr:hypothetical protein EE612_027813 [Oryza sativa]BAS92786.1 Os05g0209950 [Oryza sativa Japonica Group]
MRLVHGYGRMGKHLVAHTESLSQADRFLEMARICATNCCLGRYIARVFAYPNLRVELIHIYFTKLINACVKL